MIEVELCGGAFDGYRVELEEPKRQISSREFLQPGLGPIEWYEFVGMIGPLARYRLSEEPQELPEPEPKAKVPAWREILQVAGEPHEASSE